MRWKEIREELARSKEMADRLIKKSENRGEGWELIPESPGEYELEEELDREIYALNRPSTLKQIVNLVRTGITRPNAKSSQDKTRKQSRYKVRYRYSRNISTESRPFCIKMVAANKLYRKEDILAMEGKKKGKEVIKEAVNPGWGPLGIDFYSIWFYKGGGNCHHHWNRQTFKFTGKASKTGDVRSPLAPKISRQKAVGEGYVVTNDPKVGTKPILMPRKGFLK